MGEEKLGKGECVNVGRRSGLETVLGVPWGSDGRVQNGPPCGGSPKPEEEGRPERGCNLEGWVGILRSPRGLGGPSPAGLPRCVTLAKFHTLSGSQFPPRSHRGQTTYPAGTRGNLALDSERTTRGGSQSLASQLGGPGTSPAPGCVTSAQDVPETSAPSPVGRGGQSPPGPGRALPGRRWVRAGRAPCR